MQLVRHEIHFLSDVLIEKDKVQSNWSLPEGTIEKFLSITPYKVLKYLQNADSIYLVKKLKPSKNANKELFILLVQLFETVFQLKIKSALFLQE